MFAKNHHWISTCLGLLLIALGAQAAQANEPPLGSPEAFGLYRDTPLQVNAPGVLVNDFDADSDPLTAELVSTASCGQVELNADGSFTYTPAAGFVGADMFEYRPHDGTQYGAPVPVFLEVIAPADEPPVANCDAFTVSEDNVLVAAAPGILANDLDPEAGSLTAVLESGPSRGMLVLNADGSFTYTPAPEFSGSDSFSYRASDGANLSAIEVVIITVTAENDAPTAAPEGFIAEEDVALSVVAPGILANDIDVEGGALSAQLLSGPEHGTVELFADGSFVYTPGTDFCGMDSFVYAATDGDAQSQPVTVLLVVAPRNDPPDFSSGGDVIVLEDAGLVSLAWAKGISAGPVDEAGQSLHFEVSVLASCDLFAAAPALDSEGNLTFELLQDAWGSAEVTVTLFDDGPSGGGESNSTAPSVFRIVVHAVNDAPSFVAGANISVPEDCRLQMIRGWATQIRQGALDEPSALRFDVIANSNAALFLTQPTVNASTGDLVFESMPDAFGVADVTLVLCEDAVIGTIARKSGTSNPQTFRISVRQVNDRPSFMIGANVRVPSASGEIAINHWATQIAAGPENESSQDLVFSTVSVSCPELFTMPPVVDKNGTLRFTAKEGMRGIATIAVMLIDDGGTNRGGENATIAIEFTIETYDESVPAQSADGSCTTSSSRGWWALAVLAPVALVKRRRTRA